jgi:hypothetical protein
VISRIWSESRPLEASTWESAAPRASVSARCGGAQATVSEGAPAGTRRGAGTDASETESTRMESVSVAPKGAPLADRFPKTVTLRFGPMRLPSLATRLRLARLRSRSNRSAEFSGS